MTLLGSSRIRRLVIACSIITFVDLLVTLIFSIFYSLSVLQGIRDIFVVLLFVEAGVLFITGGLISYGGSFFFTKVRQFLTKTGEDWTPEKTGIYEKNALFWILLGSILFLESIIISSFI